MAFQWLNEAICFVSGLMEAYNIHLRNRLLLVAANCWRLLHDNTFTNNILNTKYEFWKFYNK